jgi:sarcosine oxidase subunit gamma
MPKARGSMFDGYVPGDTVARPGIAILAAVPMRRYALRARDPAVLAALIGRALPAKIGQTEGGIACLGPDEFYARLPADAILPDGAGQPVSVVDISARAVGIVLEGELAIDVLTAGCPLNLANWPVGRTSRTIFETVEIIVAREAETRWHVEVWRSFAPWLWAALSAAAAD